MRWQPSLHVVPHYESNKLYIKALVSSLKEKLNEIVETRFSGGLSRYTKKYFEKGSIIVIVKKPQDSLLKVFMRSQ